jgi:hypothetical protein
MVPVAFLSKDPVAPDLKVHDGLGEKITAPTMVENMAMTCAAVRLIAADAGIALDGMLPELIRQVIFEEPFDADIALSVFEEEAPEADDLFELLTKLVNQFLLWVPLEGEPGCDRQVLIARRAPRRLDPILRPSVEEVSISYELEDGWADFTVEVAAPPLRLDIGQLFERVLLAFGLRSIEIESQLDDTRRFASYHHCVRAPRGFVVREVRVGCPKGEARDAVEQEVERIDVPVDHAAVDVQLVPANLEDEPTVPARSAPSDAGERRDDELELEEVEPGPGLLVQGHDSEISHVHCSQETNVSPLIVRTTLATSAHLTSLWMLVVLLSAALLWLFERQGLAAAADDGGRLEVAAGALLIIPTLAAAWAIRADESAATRLVLSGTRLLLLLCGLLSISAALTLADVLPLEFGAVAGIDVYASLAYFAAVIVTSSWVLSLRPTWYVYRHWLLTPLSHLRATAVLLALAALFTLLARLSPMSRYAAACALIVVGLCLVAVAANRIGARLSEPRGPAPMIATFAATLAFLGAGYWLGYYDELVRASTVQLATISVLAVLGAISCRSRELLGWQVSR